MRGKILLILAGFAALSILLIFPPDENARRPYRQPSIFPWEFFWLMLFFRDSWGGGPTEFSKNIACTLSIAGVGIVCFVTGVVISEFRLEMIGLPMVLFSVYAVLWQEHRKGVARKEELKRAPVRTNAGKDVAVTEAQSISMEVIFSSGNPELKSIIQQTFMQV